mmetsp:Transcript_4761/g.8896  ORF Transcript_4761/g.8896 Transcript_4761/m.8896 type:complete len:239 (-) Transcript_4761:25-741(-)
MLSFLEVWFYVPAACAPEDIDAQRVAIYCQVCKETFPSKRTLNTHLKLHAEPVVCTVCGKPQTDKSRLARHMLVHTQEKNFKCTYCDRTFTHNCNRKIHERIHTGEKPYKCSLCSFSAAQLGNMKTHMRLKHKHILPDQYCLSLDSDQSTCRICSKSFTSNMALKLHMTCHQSLTLHECSICKKQLKGQYNYEKHMQLHIKELDSQYWNQSLASANTETPNKPFDDLKYKMFDSFSRY